MPQETLDKHRNIWASANARAIVPHTRMNTAEIKAVLLEAWNKGREQGRKMERSDWMASHSS